MTSTYSTYKYANSTDIATLMQYAISSTSTTVLLYSIICIINMRSITPIIYNIIPQCNTVLLKILTSSFNFNSPIPSLSNNCSVARLVNLYLIYTHIKYYRSNAEHSCNMIDWLINNIIHNKQVVYYELESY